MAPRKRDKPTPQSKLDATPPWPGRERPTPEATTGPYDVRDTPDDGINRVDFGGLQVPATEGLEMRLEIAENQQVVSVTLLNASGHMQLGVFAAPRSGGIWGEVRAEIAESLREQGGAARENPEGPFGTEVVGTLKVDGRNTPVRFLGVDGPRWFLRGMLVGAVAADATRARPFETAFCNVVVVRGNEPLPVRDQVALRLPASPLDEEGADAELADFDAPGT